MLCFCNFLVLLLKDCFCSHRNLKSNSDCVPFEEGLAEPEEEEPPKTLLEVSQAEEIQNCNNASK